MNSKVFDFTIICFKFELLNLSSLRCAQFDTLKHQPNVILY